MNRAKQISSDALIQGVNSILYFKRHPDEAEVALEAALQVSAEIQRRCEARGIPWIFVYIPSVFEGDHPAFAEVRGGVRSALGLGDEDLGVIGRLADRLLGHLRDRGIEVVDLREHFDAGGGPWHWSELHINLRGHRRAAEALEPVVEAAF